MALRIVMAEDSQLYAQALGDLIRQQPDMELIAIAENGEEAVRLCMTHRPDLVVMDIQMPKVDGLQATETIMATCPTPILVVTSDPFRGGVDMSFRALSAGALDLLPKPTLIPLDEGTQARFIQKIRLLADIPVVRHVRGTRAINKSKFSSLYQRQIETDHMILGIVSSTGGPKALAKIFSTLPDNLPLSILIVQHITKGFCQHLAQWLNTHSAWQIELAREGQTPQPNHAYIAPSGHHLELDGQGHLRVYAGPPVNNHRPNGDLLLRSLAQYSPKHSFGLILSGMGKDGADGLAAMHKSGCTTLAQDEASSVVYGMPGAALSIGAVDHVVNLDAIADIITHIANRRSR